MTAGIETLKALSKPGVYKTLEKNAADLEKGLRAAAAEAGVSTTFNRVGSMFTCFFTDRKVTTLRAPGPRTPRGSRSSFWACSGTV